ncbi:MAG: SDR family NAD(P)-dependent oxidoreductase [Synechococcaceae cyanobacterium SM2_3_1]|nr:SDR family NAD(P)-dependent oxidoreductase [Synechococcaceae cyanobacterium SM2_3_1]
MTKVLAIVGMGEGNGMAIARRFGQAGFTIAMLARNQAKLEGYVATLSSEDLSAHAFVADAGDKHAVESALQAIHRQLEGPEVLVYNAAVPRMENVLTTHYEDLILDFQANVAGALVAAQTVVPYMQEEGQGTILITGGGFALYPHPDFASLAIGKAGIRSLAFTLAAALQDKGIRVGTVTICGTVDPADPKYNPDTIAEEYWKLYSADSPDVEVVY